MSALPTSLGVREMRAQIMLDALRAHPELVEVAADIPRLPRLSGWNEPILADAIDRLVAEGQITEDATGRLVVAPPVTQHTAAAFDELPEGGGA